MAEAFTDLLTSVWSGVSSVVTTISASSLLLIPVGFMFAGRSIGLAKSLMGTKGGKRR